MLRALIVDDETPARNRLRTLLAPQIEAGRLQVVGEASDGPSALEFLASHTVDLLFLDIRMPEMNGFDVLEQIPPERYPVVVFITAHDTYSLRAFEANAVDYLLKPIVRERLDEAITRAERLQALPENRRESGKRLDRLLDWFETHAAAPTAKPQQYLERITIPYRDRILVISTDRLVSAEIIDGITRLFVLVEDARAPRPLLRQHIVSHTLDQLESSLNPEEFVRVHRSSIVRLKSIKEMIPWFSGRYKLVLEGRHEVIASRERSRALKERLMM